MSMRSSFAIHNSSVQLSKFQRKISGPVLALLNWFQ